MTSFCFLITNFGEKLELEVHFKDSKNFILDNLIKSGTHTKRKIGKYVEIERYPCGIDSRAGCDTLKGNSENFLF